MMEYFPSSLWISLCTDPGAHTHTNGLVSVSTHAERPMHHTKVSCVALTLMSLISAGCQWGVCHILHQSAAETVPCQEIRRCEAACRCVQDKELKSWFHAYTITHSVYKPGWSWVVIVFRKYDEERKKCGVVRSSFVFHASSVLVMHFWCSLNPIVQQRK